MHLLLQAYTHLNKHIGSLRFNKMSIPCAHTALLVTIETDYIQLGDLALLLDGFVTRV